MTTDYIVVEVLEKKGKGDGGHDHDHDERGMDDIVPCGLVLQQDYKDHL